MLFVFIQLQDIARNLKDQRGLRDVYEMRDSASQYIDGPGGIVDEVIHVKLTDWAEWYLHHQYLEEILGAHANLGCGGDGGLNFEGVNYSKICSGRCGDLSRLD